ncbi:MAG: GTP-binding protein [Peptostreptococcaceae bacterium]|nr:GTP-binding protein [Peptostreptococcaceae bacterium]
MVKIIILTGFLGSGKTTMMQSLIASYSDEKIGLIINEFGEINIDAKLVTSDGIDMAELTNGSIFCACIKDKFVESLIEMSKKDIDYLFIESSGLADPSNMDEIVRGIEKETSGNLKLEGSVCIVDALNFIELMDVMVSITRQIEHANAIIVNKMDLIEDEKLREIEEEIKKVNPYAYIYPATYCSLDIKNVVSKFIENHAVSNQTTNTYETRPYTFIIRAEEILDYDKLNEFINNLSKDTYRIKGFAKTDKGPVEVNSVLENVVIESWKDNVETEIVAISKVGVKLMSEIIKQSNEVLDGKVRV